MIWNYMLIFLLAALNEFFVATEFAVITSRKTRKRLLSEQGNSAAQLVLNWLENPSARDKLIEEVNEYTGKDIQDLNYDTLADSFLGHLDHISKNGEDITLLGGSTMQVLEINGTRISKIQMTGV